MIDPRRRVVAGPAGELVVWDYPGGPPDALLLHGIGGAGRTWDFVASATAGRLRLLAPDARGHGDSARPGSGYAPSDFVADVGAILDAERLDRVVLVGHSMGGGHALAFTLAHPERVSRLVVIDIGPTLEREGAERSSRLTRTRPELFADATAADRYMRETSPGYTDEVYAHRLRWLLHETPDGLAWRSDAAALGRILESAGGRGRYWERLPEIGVPVLVVRGARSIYLSGATAARMVAAIPDARLVELDAGHNVQLDRPTELAEAIVAFAHDLHPRPPRAQG